MDDSRADGGEGRRPRPLFDPVAGMRAVADIQAEGLRAAGDLLERMLRSEPDGHASPARPRGDYAALVDAWADLLQRFAAGLAQPPQPGTLTVPVDSGAVGPPVRLTLGGPEGPAAGIAEVWLHNGTFSAVGPLTLRCGALSAADGTVLDGAGVRFEPREVGILPGRSSRAVEVSLVPNGAVRPGTYRGTIQADGAPMLWLPLEVAIAPC